MCIIIDVDKFGELLSDPPSSDFEPIMHWLKSRRGSVVYTTYGDYGNELGPNAKIRLEQFKTSGYAKSIEDESILTWAENFEKNEHVTSNDTHILALAKVSGARLLFTGDQKLMDDFKNSKIIHPQKGRIYSGARNAGMLQRTVCDI